MSGSASTPAPAHDIPLTLLPPQTSLSYTHLTLPEFIVLTFALSFPTYLSPISPTTVHITALNHSSTFSNLSHQPQWHITLLVISASPAPTSSTSVKSPLEPPATYSAEISTLPPPPLLSSMLPNPCQSNGTPNAPCPTRSTFTSTPLPPLKGLFKVGTVRISVKEDWMSI